MSITAEARTKLINLFSFLKAVEQRRTTLVRNVEDRPWKLRWADLPNHQSLLIQRPDAGNEFSLTLERPEIHPCPIPPDSIKDWLVAGWEDTEKSAEHIDKKTEFDAQGIPLEVYFEQQPERREGWFEWNSQRNLWVEAERPARAALRIWERLFALRSQIEREGETYELVLGGGFFDWESLHHPILLRRVELSFDPHGRAFHIGDSEEPAISRPCAPPTRATWRCFGKSG